MAERPAVAVTVAVIGLGRSDAGSGVEEQMYTDARLQGHWDSSR